MLVFIALWLWNENFGGSGGKLTTFFVWGNVCTYIIDKKELKGKEGEGVLMFEL